MPNSVTDLGCLMLVGMWICEGIWGWKGVVAWIVGYLLIYAISKLGKVAGGEK